MESKAGPGSAFGDISKDSFRLPSAGWAKMGTGVGRAETQGRKEQSEVLKQFGTEVDACSDPDLVL